jgi:hypothetical protein
MPMDRSKYPDNWEQMGKEIREQAGDKCEFCGLKNKEWIVRSDIDPARYMIFDIDVCEYQTPDGDPIRMSEIPEEFCGPDVQVILTVAHLDQDTTNNAPENLKLLCQRCHLNHDRPHNQVKGKATRISNKHKAIRQAGQLPLLD